MDEQPPYADETVALDARNLRGMAHPLRVRLLGLLRLDGPSTATRLARRLGESSASTSYHLRQLATYGFVVEDPDRTGRGRERWWRAAARFTHLPRTSAREAMADAEGFLRALASEQYQELTDFLAELAALPAEWDDGWMVGDRVLRLTAAEAASLRREIRAVVDRYRADQPGPIPDAPADAGRVILQVQLLPRLASGGTA